MKMGMKCGETGEVKERAGEYIRKGLKEEEELQNGGNIAVGKS